MDQKKIVADAFNDMAPNYEAIVDGELKRFWGWHYDDFVNELLSHLPTPATGKILDVATGTAVIPRKLISLQQSPEHIFGLDLTMGMLQSGSQKIAKLGKAHEISLTNGNAMQMPYQDNTFDILICGLATHHMDVHVMLAEMNRIIKPGGKLLLVDVGAGILWKIPIYHQLIQLSTLVYFTIQEGFSRARAEMSALPNIHTHKEWKTILEEEGFENISIKKLWRKFFWIPNPLIIQAKK
jgi:demethylmenaquinone methyltransferase/2-methoxy-6-polyprenyl-1,4-benzoquinol methylase